MRNHIAKTTLAASVILASCASLAQASDTVDPSVFGSIVKEHRAEYAAGTTEIQMTRARIKRGQRLCELGSAQAVAWVGNVVEVTSESDGNAGLVVDLGNDITLKSFGALFGAGTMKDPTSAVYETLISLNPGDTVEFSGQFQSEKKDCFRELSLTERGSMTEPEYEFDFVEVRRR